MKRLSKQLGSFLVVLCLLTGNSHAVEEREAEVLPASLNSDLPADVDWEAEALEIRRGAEYGLPETFSLLHDNRVTSVKERKKDSDGWAFASIGALESYMMVDKVWSGEEHDFSERNLLRQSICGNSTCCDSSFWGDGNLGLAYFAARKGPVDENLDPYEDCCPTGKLPVFKAVREAYFVDASEIKQMLYRHRSAVQVKIHMPLDEMNSPYYNPDPNNPSLFVYHPGRWMNEEVLIVGWSDSYSKENFINRPLMDGAFLCKHSKGEEFGKGGYFYLSYMDKSLNPPKGYTQQQGLIYIDAENIDPDEYLYQYDEYGMVGGYGSPKTSGIWFANVFKRREPRFREELNSVAFYTLSDNLDYEVWLGDSKENMKMVKSGRMPHRGYHTVNLPQKEYLDASEFVVAVKLYTEDSESIAVEYRKKDYTDRATVADGQSFVSDDGKHWTDVSKEKIWIDDYEIEGVNVCLKAITKQSRDVLPVEPDILKKAEYYKYYTTNYVKKDWVVEFTVDVDPISAEEEIKIFEKDTYQELPIRLVVEDNKVRLYLKDYQVGDRHVERAYERGKEYIIYIGHVQGRSKDGKLLTPMRKPKKAIFRVN